MKGLEFKMLLGLILLVVVIVLIMIVVIGPSLVFSSNINSRTQFEDFCVFWSLNGYTETIDESVIRNDIDHGTPRDYCGIPLGKLSIVLQQDPDILNCIKCCKKEIAC